MKLPRFISGYLAAAQSFGRDLEEKKRWFVSGILVFYFAAFCVIASRRAFWFDELFTVYLANLSSTRTLLAALSHGADLAPPLYHLTTHAAVSLLGPGQLAVRLPSIAGFGVMIWCLFWFVSRRAPALYAAIAMLLPFLTGAERYAVEARPYGMMLGFCGLALLSWQRAAEGDHRRLALAGLALSLGGAVSTHYYAGLMLLPLGAGEFVRSLRLRHLDIGIWSGLFLGILPLPLHFRFFRLSQPYLHNAWSAPGLSALFEVYRDICSPVILVSAAIALLATLLSRFRSDGRIDLPMPPAQDWVAGGVLLALPLVVLGVAAAITGVFVSRYALPAVVGFAILTSFLLRSADGKLPLVGGLFFFGISTAFVLVKFLLLLQAAFPAEPPSIPEVLRDAAEPDIPIVVDSPFRFLELSYYAPAALQSRLYYLADPSEARRLAGSNAPDSGLLALRAWAPIHVDDCDEFLARHKTFLLYWQPDMFGWVLARLTSQKNRIQIQAQHEDQFLIAVKQE